jgi:hypothetical protein
MGDGARYWRLIDGSWWSIEETKSPRGDRSFEFWLKLILKSRHLTRVFPGTHIDHIFFVIIVALFRGIGFVAWAGAFLINCKFITFGGTFVAFVANLSIKIGFASGATCP